MIKPCRDFFRIREDVPRWEVILLGLLPATLLLLLWMWATTAPSVEERAISPVILPSPVEVVASFPSLWGKRDLAWSVLYSLGRVAAGFLIGAVLAVPLGIGMGAFGRVKHLFLPLAAIGGYIPIAALVPLTMMWFGIGEWQKVMFLAIATFIYLLPLAFRAVVQVDDVYVETAATLGAGTWTQVTRVLLPIALAEIYNAMRLAFAVGWSYIILAEIVDAERGLGNLIITSQRRGPREHIFLVILVIALVGYAVDKVFGWLGRILFPYKAGA
jgi:ABC-type nitrate/sulfonate/bicarbonate transport system permease component